MSNDPTYKELEDRLVAALAELKVSLHKDKTEYIKARTEYIATLGTVEDVKVLTEQLAAAEAMLEKAHHWIDNYATHRPVCTDLPEGRCECGLSQLIADLAKGAAP